MKNLNKREKKSRIYMEKYYELIIYLLDCYNDGLFEKEVLKGIPEEDIQAARKWVYQRQKNHDNSDFGVVDNSDRIQNAFDFEEWEWSDN